MITESLVCALMIPASITAVGPHPIEAPANPTETVHVCWPVDESGALTGTTITMPIEDAVLAYREIRANAALIGDNRMDLVFVGDGYTAGELGQYTLDVNNVVASFFQYEPFLAYEPYFRISQVDVVSPESGVDNDPQGTFRNTALDMSYWCSNIERLLCVNTSKAYAAANNAGVSDIDQIIALANSSKYGGAGYSSSNLGTAAGQNGSAVQIAIHEIGHSMGNLADEYTYGGSETYSGGEPGAANSSIYTAAEQIAQLRKWHQWIGTPLDPRFDDPISTYEGSSYSTFGVYRPSYNSMMRSLARQFNQPSAEALIMNIYQEVSPIDDASPPGSYAQGDTLWVTPMQPVGHTLDVTWSIDGSHDPSLDGLHSIDVDSLNLPAGVHSVIVTVIDPTDMVIDETIRNAWLKDARAWTIDLACDNTADFNGDGIIDNGDIGVFIAAFIAHFPPADINGDGVIDNGDIGAFVDAFLNPC